MSAVVLNVQFNSNVLSQLALKERGEEEWDYDGVFPPLDIVASTRVLLG